MVELSMPVFSVLCKTLRNALRALVVHVDRFVGNMLVTLYLVFLLLFDTNSSE